MLTLTSGCTSSDASDKRQSAGKETLRLGYFANITHAPALIAVGKGFVARELGSVTLEAQAFNAGPAAIEALNAGAIDATYIGPGPTINGFVKSGGQALRIVSGAVVGGAQLVVQPKIKRPAQLKGRNLASPQLGGTQDVALRSWLTSNSLKNSRHGDGDVTITPTENAQTFELFRAGKIDGAWLPEPWASRLVIDAGAKVLVDEASLWPKGQFVTTHLVVGTKFLREHPRTVEALLRAHLDAIDWIKANTSQARPLVNAQIASLSGKPLSNGVLVRAFASIDVTSDPLPRTLPTLLDRGVAAGLTKPASMQGIYDLRLLNKVLSQRNQPTVSAAGLGEE